SPSKVDAEHGNLVDGRTAVAWKLPSRADSRRARRDGCGNVAGITDLCTRLSKMALLWRRTVSREPVETADEAHSRHWVGWRKGHRIDSSSVCRCGCVLSQRRPSCAAANSSG